MDLNPAKRRSVRLTSHDYLAGTYFITICAAYRSPLFGEIREGKMILNRFGHLVRKQWESTGRLRKNIRLDAFVVMPDLSMPSYRSKRNHRWCSVGAHCNVPLRGTYGMCRNDGLVDPPRVPLQSPSARLNLALRGH